MNYVFNVLYLMFLNKLFLIKLNRVKPFGSIKFKLNYFLIIFSFT